MVTVIVVVGAVVLWMPTIADLWHILRVRPAAGPSREPLPRLLFLIPAHDEELLVGHTIASVRQLEYPADRVSIVVVADNCTDSTAETARATGARVLERHDARMRGKQHALAWAIPHCELDAHDAVVILDADTELDPGFAAALAARAPLRDKVVQPYNGVQNRADSAITRMAAVQSEAMHGLAFRLKARSGITVPLSAGMCIGSGVLEERGWPAFSIGEDFELYVILTLAGVSIDHAGDARVYAQEARDLKQAGSQRRRWMSGRWYVFRRYTGAILRSRTLPVRQRLDALCEMTSVALGPATQLALTFALATLAFVSRVPAATTLAVLVIASLGRQVAYTALAVSRDPEPWRAAFAFVRLPTYVVWRLAVAASALLSSGTGAWVRTARHARDR